MGFFQKGGEKVYFDIHSHILPGIDDGAKDITESAELINFMKKEGITEVIATPHFYPNEMSLGDFLEHRNNAYETLCSNLDGDIPRIYIGCEILYFKSIYQIQKYKLIHIHDEFVPIQTHTFRANP